MLRATAIACGVALVVALRAHAQDPPRGSLIENVKSPSDASQSYALYVPSTYTPDRAWSLLLAFHPAARGRAIVEKYQTAAEEYGYIVAGSNTSRNGPWTPSAGAVRAMSLDLGRQFAIDAERVYLTGLSGGARVALQVALGSNNRIAGVIASSAGYPDTQPRASVPFALFSTAGTEDFNYIEMRRLDRTLKSPHFLSIFEGGHALPPDHVGLEAIEWLEVQAIRSGRRARDEALISRLHDKRLRQVDASRDAAETLYLLEALVADFEGLRDVTGAAARARQLSTEADVKNAVARQREADDDEWQTIGLILETEARLADRDERADALARLRSRLAALSRTSLGADDSPARRQARRILGAIASGVRQRTTDSEYLKLIDQYAARPAR
jgi:pimeloyl-ACP methyl ester carboxylesterase